MAVSLSPRVIWFETWKTFPERLRAFAVKPAHRQAKLVHRLNDGIDLFGEHQARQMQHRAHPDAGAEIGRARGQITKFIVEGEIQLLFQRRSSLSTACHASRVWKPGRNACIRR